MLTCASNAKPPGTLRIQDPMARYFFHIRNDVETEDEEGTEFPDVEAARLYAVQSARSLISADIQQGHLDLGHRIIVTDELGEEVLVLTFGDAFDLKDSR